MNIIIKYGWYALLIAMVGDLIIPFILSPFYREYSNSAMSISVLGNSNSPVRLPFNLWMLFEGILFLFAVPALYNAYCQTSKALIIATAIFISVFAVGACIFTCFFSVNETKDIVTIASKIHGAGSVIGFMLLLLVPLLLAILSFKAADNVTGIISCVSFLLALLFFVLFVMSDKPNFQGTLIAKEGLWQRLNLLFMYLPLGFISVKHIISRL